MVESWNWLLQLAEKGSITRAAESLHISQQTLSSRLAVLEKELDAKLFVRTSPLSPTRAGEAFLEYAREGQRAREDMLRRVAEVTIGGAGKLKVGISNVGSRTLMPQVVRQFHESLPGVSVRLVEGTNEDIVHMVERDEVDVALALFGGVHPGVAVRPLMREQMVAVAAPALIARAAGVAEGEVAGLVQREGLLALSACPFMLTSEDDISGRIARSELRAAHMKPTVLVESDSTSTLLSLAAAGIGCAFCSTNVLDSFGDATKGLVRVPLSPEASYELSVGRPANAEPWTPAQLFEDILGALYG